MPREFLEYEDVEPGSGAMYIPILGRLFPKLYGQKMRAVDSSYLVTENGERYSISTELKKIPSTPYKLHFAEKSGVYLGCSL